MQKSNLPQFCLVQYYVLSSLVGSFLFIHVIRIPTLGVYAHYITLDVRIFAPPPTTLNLLLAKYRQER